MPDQPAKPNLADRPSKLLSISQAAAILKVSTKTLKRWEKKGIITSLRTKGGQRRYHREYIQNLSLQKRSLNAFSRQKQEEKLSLLPSAKRGKTKALQVPTKYLLASLALFIIFFSLYLKTPHWQKLVKPSIGTKLAQLVDPYLSLPHQTQDTLFPVLGDEDELPLITTAKVDSTSDNLVLNSSFEAAFDDTKTSSNGFGQPRFWGYTNMGHKDNIFVSDESIREGTLALKLEDKAVCVSGNASTCPSVNLGISQSEATTRNGANYNLSVFIRTKSLTGSPQLRLGFLGGTQESVFEDFSLPLSGSSYSNWQRFEFVLENAEQGTYPFIEIIDYQSGIIYLDDAQLTEGKNPIVFHRENLLLGDGTIKADVFSNIYPTTDALGSLGLEKYAFGQIYVHDLSIKDDLSISDELSVGSIASHLVPATDGTYNLGSSSYEWQDLFVDGTATIDNLTVDENATIIGSLTVGGSSSQTGDITINKADPTLIFDVLTDTDTDFWMGVQEDASGDDDDLFQIGDGTTAGSNPFLTIDTSGKVGIGTTNPQYPLDVFRSPGVSIGLRVYGEDSPGIMIQTIKDDGATNPNIGFVDANDVKIGQIVSEATSYAWHGEGSLIIDYTGSTGGMFAIRKTPDSGSEADRVFMIDSVGNVGIGTTTPSTFTLQVAGNTGPDATNTYNLGSGSTSRMTTMDQDLSTADASFWGEGPSGDNDQAGISVSIVGDVNGDDYDDILIGAYYNDDADTWAGQTYLVLGGPSGWAMDTVLSTADASFWGEDANDTSGGSVAGAGDVNGDGYDDILIGAAGDDDGGGGAGQTYLILGKASGWAMDTDLSAADASFWGESASDNSGTMVAGVGDVNGDGYDDFTIGAPSNVDGGSSAGQTYLILGQASGWAMDTDLSAADASFWGEDADDNSGISVAGAGDVNGDGYDDILIGAAGDEDGGSLAGQIYLILGKASGWAMDTDLSAADASFWGESASDLGGWSVAGAGDVNGDGYDDFAIGAPGNVDGGSSAGQTYLMLGQASAWAMDTDLSAADASFWGEDDYDASGWSVAGAGDVNGDGYDDILIGANMSEDGGSFPSVGQIYLILGKASGWAMDTDLSAVDASFWGENDWDYTGNSVSGAGDVNGDGYDDILIGSWGSEAGGASNGTGQTYLILSDEQQWDNVFARNVKAGDSLNVGDNLRLFGETIQSLSPLYLDVTRVNVQGGLTTLGNVGIGTTVPDAGLHVAPDSTSGELFEIDWTTGTTQGAGALTGALIDFTNLTGTASQVTYGLHINDPATDMGAIAGNQYGIYQQGTNWDYGLYVEDAGYFDTSLDVEGQFSVGTQVTITDDTTPDVSASSSFLVDATGAQTITDFDADGGTLENGQIFFLEFADGDTTIDCDGGAINCGSTDIVGAGGDIMTFFYDGTDWHMVSYMDDSDNQNAGSGFDLAEYYVSTEELESGDVVSIDPVQDVRITKSAVAYDPKAIGIISTQPGFILGDSTEENTYLVGLVGRVSVKVSENSETISAGDYLTTSPEAGLAMKATRAGYTLGKALESWSPDSGKETVLVFINLGWHNPQPLFALDSSGNVSSSDNDKFLELSLLSNQISDQVSLLTEESQQIQETIAELNQEIDNLKSDISNIKKQTALLQETVDLLLASQTATGSASPLAANILGVQTPEATLSALTVTDDTLLNNLNLTGNLNAGLLIIDGLDASIETIGFNNPLKLQPNALSGIDLVGGRVEIDKQGNVSILGDLALEGALRASENIRGTNIQVAQNASQATIEFLKPKPTPEYAISVTPNWNTNYWIDSKSQEKFTVRFSTPAPENASIDWITIE